MQYNAIPCNTMQYHTIPCNTMQYHAIPCNTMQYNAMPCYTLQCHASLITADGAYHCPVGSIMAIFIFFIILAVVKNRKWRQVYLSEGDTEQEEVTFKVSFNNQSLLMWFVTISYFKGDFYQSVTFKVIFINQSLLRWFLTINNLRNHPSSQIYRRASRCPSQTRY